MAGRLRLRPALRRYAHSVQRRAAPSGYVGPYDAIPDIVAAYGMRRLLSSYTGPILRLRRDSDQTEQDFGYTDNGDLDTAAIATWLGGASGYITTWYDQSGNANHAAQATAASQPLYVAAGQNGRPVPDFDGANDNLEMPALFTNMGDSSWLAVARSDHAGSRQRYIEYNNDGGFMNMVVNFSDFNHQMSVSDGASKIVTSNTSETSPFLATFIVRENVDINGFINGTAMTGNGTAIGTLAVVSNLGRRIGSNRDGAADFFNGPICEVVIATSAWSTADRQAAEMAANAYWSVF